MRDAPRASAALKSNVRFSSPAGASTERFSSERINMSENPQLNLRPAVPPPTPADISLFEENGRIVFRTQDGMTIYRYDRDTGLKPTCVGECSRTWPPVLASPGATQVVGDWKTIERDGARQWSFRGRPVYTYVHDLPGTSKGDGVEGVWHALKL
jgi:predicted lipoprotein with Yx(FWY)xxD motif